MGVGILILANNADDFMNTPEYDEFIYKEHDLSPAFIGFTLRSPNIVSKFEEISRKIDVDIEPLYEMFHYCDDECLKEIASFYSSFPPDRLKEIIDLAKLKHEKVIGNIDRVLSTVTELIAKLSKIKNVEKLVSLVDEQQHNFDTYLANFNRNSREDLPWDNTFGQDLRNLKKYIEYAQEHGATTVYFHIE